MAVLLALRHRPDAVVSLALPSIVPPREAIDRVLVSVGKLDGDVAANRTAGRIENKQKCP